IFAFAVALAIAHEAAARILKRRRYRGRKHLSDNELLQLFATPGLDDKDIHMFMLEVSRAIGIRRSLLRPTDRFDAELAPVRWLSYDDGMFLLPEVLESRLTASAGELQFSVSSSL